jgi:hypothetical protein
MSFINASSEAPRPRELERLSRELADVTGVPS